MRLARPLSIVAIVTLLAPLGLSAALDRYQDSLLLLAALALGRPISSASTGSGDRPGALVATTWAPRRRVCETPASCGQRHARRQPRTARASWRAGGRTRSRAACSPCRWSRCSARSVAASPLARRRDLRCSPRRSPCGSPARSCCPPVPAPGAAARRALLIVALRRALRRRHRRGDGARSRACAPRSASACGSASSPASCRASSSRSRGASSALLSGTGLLLTALLAQRERIRRAIAASMEHYRRSSQQPVPDVGGGPGSTAGSASPTRRRCASTATTPSGVPCAARRGSPGRRARTRAAGRPLGSRSTSSSATAPRRRRDRRRGHAHELGVRRRHRPGVLHRAAVGARCELRLAALTAGDLERFRLGGDLRDRLNPILARSASRPRNLRRRRAREPRRPRAAGRHRRRPRRGALCRRLTRGASPLQGADGDLIAAIRQLPASLRRRGAGDPGLGAATRAVTCRSRAATTSIGSPRTRCGRPRRARARATCASRSTQRERTRLLVDDDGDPVDRARTRPRGSACDRSPRAPSPRTGSCRSGGAAPAARGQLRVRAAGQCPAGAAAGRDRRRSRPRDRRPPRRRSAPPATSRHCRVRRGARCWMRCCSRSPASPAVPPVCG